ncbi:MAG TPA: hypothetical protein VIL13_14125 [Longimicrobiales bacterium]
MRTPGRGRPASPAPEGPGRRQAAPLGKRQPGRRRPRHGTTLQEWLNDADPARSKRVGDALLRMVKPEIAVLEAAYRS